MTSQTLPEIMQPFAIKLHSVSIPSANMHTNATENSFILISVFGSSGFLPKVLFLFENNQKNIVTLSFLVAVWQSAW